MMNDDPFVRKHLQNAAAQEKARVVAEKSALKQRMDDQRDAAAKRAIELPKPYKPQFPI